MQKLLKAYEKRMIQVLTGVFGQIGSFVQIN